MEQLADRTLSTDEIARINAEHLITTPLRPADLLFVFGTREGVPERVNVAHQLWRDEHCRWLVVSGGATLGLDVTECEVITDALLARGVPAALIIREGRPTKTRENEIFSLPPFP